MDMESLQTRLSFLFSLRSGTHRRSYLFVLCTLVVFCTMSTACEEPLSEALCRDSQHCALRGRCLYEPATNKCFAGKDIDCRKSRFCLNLGECTAQGGRCIATIEADCRNATECKRSRRCIPSSGECVELNPGYCRISHKRCKTHGECSLDFKGNSCAPGKDLDCSASELCKQTGKCSVDLSKKECVIKNESDCQQSLLCAAQGKCQFKSEAGKAICLPTAHQDCAQSQHCKDPKHKKCAYNPHTQSCVAGDVFCRQTVGCKKSAKCTWDNTSQTCLLLSDKDCKQSTLCTLSKRCTLRTNAGENECVRAGVDPCKLSLACSDEGRCKTKEKKCIADTEEDCQNSTRCAEEGLCKLSAEKCMIDDCQGEVCRVYGKCKKSEQKGLSICLPSSEQDCLQSQRCRENGFCKKDGNVCVQGS